MKNLPLFVSLTFLVLYKVIVHITANQWISLSVFIIPITFLILNFTLRKKLKYKSWFLTKINFFLEKRSYTLNSDISETLLFEKILEVIKDSEFSLYDSNKSELSILCGTSTTFWTWGENIYIKIQSLDKDLSCIIFETTTIYGSSSWNRNQKHYESFISSFEASLTI